MAESGGAIYVAGLREFQRGLRQAETNLAPAMRDANKEVAETIAAGTRASFLSRPGVALKVAPSVKATAEQRRAAVKIGGDRYPFALGSEFGSFRYRQFPAWRGNSADAGYSLHPTIRSEREQIAETYLDLVVDKVARRAFPD